MSRFRSMLGRIAKPLAMVGIVGTLSLSLVVSTPSSAHAWSVKYRDVKAAETFVMGATKTLAPVAQVAMVAGTFTPVGLGVRAFQLGMILYSTSDIWMPIVAGLFGESKDNAPAASGANVLPGLVYQVPAVSTPNYRLVVHINYTGGPLVETVTVMARYTCKRPDNSTYNKDGLSSPQIGTDSSHFRTADATMYCDTAADVAVGWIVGPPGGAPELVRGTTGPTSYKGPESVLRGGTMSDGQTAFNPYAEDVKYKVKSECINADGTKTFIEAESSGDYVKFPSCEAAGKGHGTGKTSITGLAPGTTVEQPLWDSPAAPSDPATPLCDAARPTGGCVLSVELDGKPCETGNPECENWAEIQKNEPNNTRLKCRFGPYTLPMSACALLEKAYFPGGSPATEENTDGNPDTSNWNDPQGAPLAPQTPTQTTIGTVPGGSGQPQPGSDEETMSCFPTGFAAFNPVEWVLQPIRCAFTPKPDTQTQFTTRLQTRIATVGFAPMATAWLAAYQDVGGGSGCSGPTVNFHMNGVSQTLQPFQACTAPMSTVAAISNGVATVGIVLFGGLAMVRAIGSAFGINFSMGGKSDGD